MQNQTLPDKLRIDKWCWMTRFYKTRKIATEAVAGGKVHVDGKRVKASYCVKTGDVLKITRAEEHWEVIVQAIPGRRGPAREACLMYEETEQGQTRRLSQQSMNKAIRVARPREEVKPDKHQRKQLRKLKHKE